MANDLLAGAVIAFALECYVAAIYCAGAEFYRYGQEIRMRPSSRIDKVPKKRRRP